MGNLLKFGSRSREEGSGETTGHSASFLKIHTHFTYNQMELNPDAIEFYWLQNTFMIWSFPNHSIFNSQIPSTSKNALSILRLSSSLPELFEIEIKLKERDDFFDYVIIKK